MLGAVVLGGLSQLRLGILELAAQVVDVDGLRILFFEPGELALQARDVRVVGSVKRPGARQL